jgi:hypothetical protein
LILHKIIIECCWKVYLTKQKYVWNNKRWVIGWQWRAVWRRRRRKLHLKYRILKKRRVRRTSRISFDRNDHLTEKHLTESSFTQKFVWPKVHLTESSFDNTKLGHKKLIFVALKKIALKIVQTYWSLKKSLNLNQLLGSKTYFFINFSWCKLVTLPIYLKLLFFHSV